MKRIVLMSFVGLLGSLFLLSMTNAPQEKAKPWTIPANYQTMKNAVKADPASTAKAKENYAKFCKSCHGAAGLGDGTKSASLKTTVPSFATKEFQGQKDGVLFFQTTVGRDEMPSFEKKIPDANERWALVNYMRTFAK
ncbi:MAG: cytochrome c [Bacteroidota bacterium]